MGDNPKVRTTDKEVIITVRRRVLSEDLITKYRPTSFDQVLGQDTVIKSLQSALTKKRGRSFLLSGPSGTGKTTLGRIISNEVGCKSYDLIEIDGASNTGIDAMREVTSHLNYASSARVIIVDEAHAISAQAFKSILKSIEEPPPGVYWVLCTTEPTKIPKEIKTRCLSYDLKPVSQSIIAKLVKEISVKEKLPIRKSSEGIKTISELAQGSPRQALSYLAKCGHITDDEEIRSLCGEEGSASKEAIDLCRLLMKGANWREMLGCIKSMEAQPESVRIVVLRYMASVAMNGKSPEKMLAIMDEFSQPFLDREGKAPLLLAVGRLCF